MNRLAVGRDHDSQHESNNNTHPDRLKGGHGSGERKRQEDFIGRVGDRRERIRREDRQSNTFGEKLVAHRVRSHRASDEHALCVGQQVRHEKQA